MRYLGIENLSWNICIHDPASKLNIIPVVLAELRYLLNEILRSTTFVKFQSHLNIVCIDWGLTRSLVIRCLVSKKEM